MSHEKPIARASEPPSGILGDPSAPQASPPAHSASQASGSPGIPFPAAPKPSLGVREFQETIEAIYLERDGARGILGTFAWFVEEVGELSRAIRRGERKNLEEEFGDCFAWLASLASLHGVDLATAAQKYANGCPRCKATPCTCPHPTKKVS